MALDDNALITLANMKIYAGIAAEVETWDAILTVLINAVSTVFDSVTCRNLKHATYEEILLDGNGQKDLDLPNWPITWFSISFLEDGVTLTEGEDFLLYGNEGYIHKINGVWPKQRKVLKLTYKAGYAADSVPADLELICMKQVAKEFKEWKAKTWGETSRDIGDGSVAISETSLLPEIEKTLLKYTFNV